MSSFHSCRIEKPVDEVWLIARKYTDVSSFLGDEFNPIEVSSPHLYFLNSISQMQVGDDKSLKSSQIRKQIEIQRSDEVNVSLIFSPDFISEKTLSLNSNGTKLSLKCLPITEDDTTLLWSVLFV